MMTTKASAFISTSNIFIPHIKIIKIQKKTPEPKPGSGVILYYSAAFAASTNLVKAAAS